MPNVPFIPAKLEHGSNAPTEVKEIPNTQDSSHVLGFEKEPRDIQSSCQTYNENRHEVERDAKGCTKFGIGSERSHWTCRSLRNTGSPTAQRYLAIEWSAMG